MTDQAQIILQQALQLSREERADLAYRLHASLADADEELISREEWEQEWADEAHRRLREVEEGTAELITWEELQPQLEAIARSPAPEA